MCSAFDLTGCLGALWHALPWWVTLAPWGIGALVALYVLSKVKDIASWPGVAAVAGVAVYLIGYWRGRHGESIIPHEHVAPDSPDALPAPRVVPTRPRALPDEPPKSLTQ